MDNTQNKFDSSFPDTPIKIDLTTGTPNKIDTCTSNTPNKMDAYQEEKERTLFVSNIDERVTEELLYELMIQAGPVENVVIKRPDKHYPYAFVIFEDEESVPYAIAMFKGTELFDRALTLKPRDHTDQERRIYAAANQIELTPSSPIMPQLNPMPVIPPQFQSTTIVQFRQHYDPHQIPMHVSGRPSLLGMPPMPLMHTPSPLAYLNVHARMVLNSMMMGQVVNYQPNPHAAGSYIPSLATLPHPPVRIVHPPLPPPSTEMNGWRGN